MTNWPNAIQCLGSDDIMSLGIKSSATEGVGSENFSRSLAPEYVVYTVLLHFLRRITFGKVILNPQDTIFPKLECIEKCSGTV